MDKKRLYSRLGHLKTRKKTSFFGDAMLCFNPKKIFNKKLVLMTYEVSPQDVFKYQKPFMRVHSKINYSKLASGNLQYKTTN